MLFFSRNSQYWSIFDKFSSLAENTGSQTFFDQHFLCITYIIYLSTNNIRINKLHVENVHSIHVIYNVVIWDHLPIFVKWCEHCRYQTFQPKLVVRFLKSKIKKEMSENSAYRYLFHDH